jgi:hypothetical protein
MSKARVHAADASASAILSDAAILERVFSFLPGNWLYLGRVCCAWMRTCKRMPVCEVHLMDPYLYPEGVTCDWRTTLMCAVFQSPSRLRLAVDCGLALNHNRDYLQYMAGWYADVPTLSLAEELGLTLSDSTVEGAAQSGHVSAMTFLVEERHCVASDDAVGCAAKSGHVDMLVYLRGRGYQSTADTCYDATSAGQLPALQYMLGDLTCTCMTIPSARCELCYWQKNSRLWATARSGNIEMVDWIRQEYHVAIDQDALTEAACSGQTAMCEFLVAYSQRNIWSTAACHRAAHHGQLGTLRWLHKHGCPWDTDVILIEAAVSWSTNSTAVMQCLQQQGVVTTTAQLTDMLNAAGAHNRLHAAKRLRKLGAQWPAVLRHYRRGKWRDDTLAWARAEGCTSPT